MEDKSARPLVTVADILCILVLVAVLLLACLVSSALGAPAPKVRPEPPPAPVTLLDIPGEWDFVWSGTAGKLQLFFPDNDKGGSLSEVWDGNRYFGNWLFYPAVSEAEAARLGIDARAEPMLVIEDYNAVGNSWRWGAVIHRISPAAPPLPSVKRILFLKGNEYSLIRR